MTNYNVQDAFYASPGTVIQYRYDEAKQVANLIDCGICQLTTVNGVRVLEVL